MGQLHIAERGDDVAFDLGVVGLEPVHQLLHPGAVEVFLAAAEVAGDDGEALLDGILRNLLFGGEDERPDDHIAAVVGAELGRHGGQLAGVEEVEEQGLRDVVAVVAERHLGAAELLGRVVEDAAAQAGAERAVGLALGHLLEDHLVGVDGEHLVVVLLALEVVDDGLLREAGVALVEVHGDHGEGEGDLALHEPQQVEHDPGVFSAGEADHDVVAGFNQGIPLVGGHEVAEESGFEVGHRRLRVGDRAR